MATKKRAKRRGKDTRQSHKRESPIPAHLVRGERAEHRTVKLMWGWR